jgi:DNA-binding MarR family transcriptional regulator
MGGNGRKEALAHRAWQLMFDYLVATNSPRAKTIAKHNLTPNEARALFRLSRDEGRRIGSLASDWACDPSNVTFIIKRLERAGFAERRQSSEDGRVKLVFLTSYGAQTKLQILHEHHRPPRSISKLDKIDLDALVKILSKLPLQSPD